jgi:Ase1/PRC1/MAP65 family protein
LSFNATTNNTSREAEVARKPFAQVKPGTQIVPTTPVSKPPALVSAETDEENRPPKIVPIIPSKTPLATPSPMHTACTPAPVTLKFEEENVKLSPEVEFSFEERRLALYLSR